MRRVQRPAAPARLKTYLSKKEAVVKAAQQAGRLDIEKTWKSARQTKLLGTTALKLLQGAMGKRERCMYCLDAHGTDIEHFWPKARYPARAFTWANWLLCCTECGRIKGSKFPLAGSGRPLLVNPCAEDPWQHLDFDADTGNLMARYDNASGAPSPKGLATVQALELDQREALSEGYRRTHRRLTDVVENALRGNPVDGAALLAKLLELDDHGLLPWCFHWAGQNEPTFVRLKVDHQAAWHVCAAGVS